MLTAYDVQKISLAGPVFLSDCFEAICAAAKLGNTACEVKRKINLPEKIKLQSLGYEIEEGWDCTKIKWDSL